MTPADVGSDRSHFLRLRAVAAHCRAGGLPYPVVSVPEGVVMTPDLLYLADEGREERGDLYVASTPPAAADSLKPAVLVVHGGGWTGGDKQAEREVNICSHLALAGYIAFSVNYVLARTEASAGRAPTWPQNFYDCQRGLQWLRLNAARLGTKAAHAKTHAGPVSRPPYLINSSS